MRKWLVIGGILLLAVAALVLVLKPSTILTPSADLFQAPGRDFDSPKKVENYFVENLRMTPEEAKEVRSLDKGNDGKISLRLSDKTTLQAVVSNLYYYGFVRDEKALMYALENTEDTVVGKANALKVGKNGTIDLAASYRISEDMDAWQIANELLNKPTYFAFDEYGYMFMP